MFSARRLASPSPTDGPVSTKRKTSRPAASQPSIVPNPSLLPGLGLHLHSVLLSAVAGYVDAAGFTTLLGLFPAHLTGEIVGDAIAFSSGHAGEHLTRLWMLPVFVTAVSLATLVARIRRSQGRRALTALLALVTFSLLLFSASEALARVAHASGHLAFLLSGGAAVAAMGFQNTLMRESLSGSCPTTVMTGNLTYVVIEVVDQALVRWLPRLRSRKTRTGLAPVSLALGAFMSCAVLGSFLTRNLGALSVALPAAATLLLTVRAWHEDRLAKAPAVLPIDAAKVPTFDVWADSMPPCAALDYPGDEPPAAYSRMATPVSAVKPMARRSK